MSNLNERTWRELAEEYGFEDCHRPQVEATFLFANRRANLALRDLGEAIRNDPHLRRANEQLARFSEQLRNFRLKL
jgi:hypothetical protein